MSTRVARIERVDRLAGEVVERPELLAPAPRRPPRAARGRAGRRRAGSAGPSRARSSRAARPRSSSLSWSVGLRSAPTAVRIPVSGERRSCETARRSAVLTRSLRRRVSASSASRSSRSRSTATASSAASAGRKRCRGGDVRVGAVRRVQRADRAVGGLERVRRVPRRRPVRRPELDLGGLDAEDGGRPRRDLVELLVEPAPAQQLGCELGEQRRLVLPLLGGGGAPPRARRELADDDGGCEVDREREPVLAVREREGVDRRQVEPVEGEHARHRDDERERQPVDDRDRQHREDVEDAEAEDGDVGLEELDRPGDDGNGPSAREERNRKPARIPVKAHDVERYSRSRGRRPSASAPATTV